jgi:hypothetical protein
VPTAAGIVRQHPFHLPLTLAIPCPSPHRRSSIPTHRTHINPCPTTPTSIPIHEPHPSYPHTHPHTHLQAPRVHRHHQATHPVNPHPTPPIHPRTAARPQDAEARYTRSAKRVQELEAQVRQLTYDFRRSRRSGGLPTLRDFRDDESVGGMTEDSFTTAGGWVRGGVLVLGRRPPPPNATATTTTHACAPHTRASTWTRAHINGGTCPPTWALPGSRELASPPPPVALPCLPSQSWRLNRMRTSWRCTWWTRSWTSRCWERTTQPLS